jgi:hypothetical protein
MKRERMHHAKDGEWMQVKRQRGHKLRCCDCGLVHTVNFRIVGRRIQFQAFRDKRATAATRERRAIWAVMKAAFK